MLVVLHICCGVCAAGAAAQLTREGHEVLGLFYNPNIHPAEEYLRRLEAAQTAARELEFRLEVPQYDPQEWFGVARSLEAEPEGGPRCDVCYRLRLTGTFEHLQQVGGDAFTTTLTIGPRKHASVINRIGQEIGGDRFMARDFKKKDGFKQATALAGEWGLYRQNYCGCVYSQRKNQKSEAEH